MQQVRKWMAAASMGLAASLLALAAHAGDSARADHAARYGPAAQPAAHVPQAAPAPSPDDMAPAGVGALDSAMGTQLSGDRAPAWLEIPRSLAPPDSSVAWIFAIGFLGFVVLRRVRGANPY